ncbi:MAG: FecR family protein [Chthoniobacterales bacterium]
MKSLARIAIATVLHLTVALFSVQNARAEGAAILVNLDNRVEVSAGKGAFAPANAGQALNIGDRLKTAEDSRATVRMADGSVLQLDELTTIEIKPPNSAGAGPTINIPGGAAFFSNGGGGREVGIETPSANGAIRGTAFVMKVNRYDGRTSVSMMDGVFDLSNIGGLVTANKGEQAEIARGALPTKDGLDDSGSSAPWYLVVENRLHTLHSLRDADRSDFFNAFPTVTKQWRFVSPQLAGSATFKKREWSKEILESAFRAVGPDCPLLKRILRSIVEADPSRASELTELAIRLYPKCAEEFQNAASGGGKSGGSGGGAPVSQNSGPFNPGSVAGGGSGQGNVVAICHNGRTIFLSPEDALRQLQNNPGDTLGACQVTPVTNR